MVAAEEMLSSTKSWLVEPKVATCSGDSCTEIVVICSSNSGSLGLLLVELTFEEESFDFLSCFPFRNFFFIFPPPPPSPLAPSVVVAPRGASELAALLVVD